MKKLLLLLASAAAFNGAYAQHITLFEEFTSENCPPCAATNPGLEALCTANPSKTILIKYEGNAPAATNPNGIYLKQVAQTNIVPQRSSYYGLTFNPYARLDGIAWSDGVNPGHASFITQARIDSVYAIASPFKLEVTSFKFNKTNDSIFADVKITAPAAYSPAGAALVLHGAFTQTLDRSSAADQGIPAAYAPASIQTNYPNRINPTGKCGYNGETIFPHVVRQMLPGANGTSISGTWTAAQTQTISLSAKLLSHVDVKDKAPLFVVWIQNNTNKRILTAATSNGDNFATAIPVVANTLGNVTVYPNPASASAHVNFTLNSASPVLISVTDMTGKVLYVESKDQMPAGTHDISISTTGFAAGLYNVTIANGADKFTERLSVVR